MAYKIYKGNLNLETIKQAVESGIKPFEGKKGKYVDISILVDEKPDQFGNHASISMYNTDTKEKFYLGNYKEFQFQNNPSQTEDKDTDLPF